MISKTKDLILNSAKSLLCFLSLSIFVLGLCACSLKNAEKRSDLEDSVKGYLKALRLKDEQALSSYVPVANQESFVKSLQKMENVEITDADVQKIFPDEKFETALVTLQLEYYSTGSASVRSARRYLRWKYEPSARVWFLDEKFVLGSN